MSPPQHADKLLYNEDRCMCNLKWCCVPHNACFIHNSCFCKGSSSFPPVKPPCPSWSDFSYKWYCELASHLELHPHSPLPRFGSEVEYSPLVMLYYRIPPPAWAAIVSVLTWPIDKATVIVHTIVIVLYILLSLHRYCLAASCCVTIIVLHSLKHRLIASIVSATIVPSLYGTISSLCISVGLSK